VPAWLRRLLDRRVERRAPTASVRLYMVDGVTVSGQLVGRYQDALVLSGAILEREGQSRGRRMDGTVRISVRALDFYEVLP
jgi:hypothetical protein